MLEELCKGIAGAVLAVLLAVTCMHLPACGDADDEGNGSQNGEVPVLEYDELVAWLQDGEDLVLIDVRTAGDFSAGHIQDAINIDLQALTDPSGALVDGGSALTSAVPDKDARIVLYCFGYGNDKIFGELARELGYSDVSRYAGGTGDWAAKGDFLVIEYAGFKAWHDAHFPFDDGENYLIDDLPQDWYSGDDPSHPGGHIPGAVNIPVELFADSDGNRVDEGKALTEVVLDKDATLDIYCGNWACGKSLMGVRAAVKLGYTRVYRYQGGWQEWQDEGNALKPGE